MAGTILTFQALYTIALLIPLSSLFLQGFGTGSAYIVATVLALAGFFLMLASGIGSLFAKKWAVVTLWISLVVSFVASMFIGHSYPSFILGDFVSWTTDAIIAIFLTIECKRSKTTQ